MDMDMMDSSTTSDQEDEEGEPVKNQVELVILEEYDIEQLTYHYPIP
jgi:hypothetical protein